MKENVQTFLATSGLPDNLRNFAQGFLFAIDNVEKQRVTKVVLKEIFSGANRNSDSGRILNPEFANLDKVMLTEFINNIPDAGFKAKALELLTDFETYLNS